MPSGDLQYVVGLDATQYYDELDTIVSAAQDASDEVISAFAEIADPVLDPEGYLGGLSELATGVEDTVGEIQTSFAEIENPMIDPAGVISGAEEMTSAVATSMDEILNAVVTMNTAVVASFETTFAEIEGLAASMSVTMVGTLANEMAPQITEAFNAAFKTISDGLENVGQTLTKVSGTPFVISAVVAGGSIFEAASRSDALQAFQGATGVSDQTLNTVNQEAQQLTALTGQSFQNILDAFRHVYDITAGTNVGNGQIMNTVEEGSKLAANNGANAGDVLNTVQTLMSQFKIPASDMIQFMGQVNVAMQDSNATLGDFVSGIGQAAEAASTTGISFSQMAAAFDVLTKGGNAPDAAGTKLKDIIQISTGAGSMATYNALADFAMASGHPEYATMLSQQNIDKIGLTGLTSMIAQITNPTNLATYQKSIGNSLTADQASVYYKTQFGQLGALSSIFPNVRASLGEQNLLNNSGELSTIQQSIQSGKPGRGGTTIDQQFNANQGKLGQELKTTGQSALNLAQTMGNDLAPALSNLLKSLTPIIQTVSVWIEKNPKLAADIVEWTLGLSGAGLVIGKLMTFLGPLVTVLGFFLTNILIPLVGFIMSSVIPALVTFATTVLLPIAPFLLVGAVVVAVVILIVTHWKQVVDFLGSAKNTIGSILGDVGGFFGDMFSGIGKNIDAGIAKIGNFFSNVGNTIKSWGSNLMKMLSQGISEGIANLPGPLQNAAKMIESFLGIHSPAETGPLSTADKWMPNLMTMMSNDIMQSGPKLKGALTNMLSGVNQAATQSILGLTSPTTSGGVSSTSNIYQSNTVNVNGGTNNAQTARAVQYSIEPILRQALFY